MTGRTTSRGEDTEDHDLLPTAIERMKALIDNTIMKVKERFKSFDSQVVSAARIFDVGMWPQDNLE